MTNPPLILATSPHPGRLSYFMDAGPYQSAKGGPIARYEVPLGCSGFTFLAGGACNLPALRTIHREPLGAILGTETTAAMALRDEAGVGPVRVWYALFALATAERGSRVFMPHFEVGLLPSQYAPVMRYLASVAREAGTTLVMSSLSPLVREAAQTCAAQILEVEATE